MDASRNDCPSEPQENGKRLHDDYLLLATDRFCCGPKDNRLAVAQFEEAYTLLSPSVAPHTLQIIARSLAREPATPRYVALALALEPVDVSEPVLLESVALGQLDLLRIAHLKGASHGAVIARRVDVGPALRATLEAIAHPAVAEALMANEAIADTADRRNAESQVAAREPVSVFVEEAVEEFAQEEAAHPPSQGTELSPSQMLLAAAARGGRVSVETLEQHGVAPSLPERSVRVADFGRELEAAARKGKRSAVRNLLMQTMGLTDEAAAAVVDDASGDTLSVAMRAWDVDAATAARVRLLAFPLVGLSTHNARRGTRFYEQLTAEGCRAAVDQWPTRDAAPSGEVGERRALPDGRTVVATDGRDAVRPAAHGSEAEPIRLAG